MHIRHICCLISYNKFIMLDIWKEENWSQLLGILSVWQHGARTNDCLEILTVLEQKWQKVYEDIYKQFRCRESFLKTGVWSCAKWLYRYCGQYTVDVNDQCMSSPSAETFEYAIHVGCHGAGLATGELRRHSGPLSPKLIQVRLVTSLTITLVDFSISGKEAFAIFAILFLPNKIRTYPKSRYGQVHSLHLSRIFYASAVAEDYQRSCRSSEFLERWSGRLFIAREIIL